MRDKEPKAIGIALPVFVHNRERLLKSEKDVEKALGRLENILGITFHTQRTGLDRNGDSWTTSATRNGKDITFTDGVHQGNRYNDIIGLRYGDSRSSALYYVLNNAVEISTDSETLAIPSHASTVDELVMKAKISNGLKWRSKDNGKHV